jgi:hypothetical protein
VERDEKMRTKQTKLLLVLIAISLFLGFLTCFAQKKEVDTLYSEQGYFYRIDIIKRVTTINVSYEPVLESGHWDSNNGCMVYGTWKVIPEYEWRTDTVIIINNYKLLERLIKLEELLLINQKGD